MAIIRGIDVYSGNGIIDWQKVVNAGFKDFCIIKCSQGRSEQNREDYFFPDSAFERNILTAASAGIREISVYHYFTAQSLWECDREISLFLKTCEPYKGLINGYAFLDMESVYLPKDRGTLTEYMARFLTEIKKHGYKPAIYTNPSWMKTRFTTSVKRWPLWLAWYTNTDFATVKRLYPKCILWQRGYARVDGVETNADVNYTEEDFLTGVTMDKRVIGGCHKVGDKYRIKAGDCYSNGKRVPTALIGREYTIGKVASGKILLSEIMSWVVV